MLAVKTFLQKSAYNVHCLQHVFWATIHHLGNYCCYSIDIWTRVCVCVANTLYYGSACINKYYVWGKVPNTRCENWMASGPFHNVQTSSSLAMGLTWIWGCCCFVLQLEMLYGNCAIWSVQGHRMMRQSGTHQDFIHYEPHLKQVSPILMLSIVSCILILGRSVHIVLFQNTARQARLKVLDFIHILHL